MSKALIIIFIVVFGLYVPVSRSPDFIDGIKAPATIHFMKDSTSGKSAPFAAFQLTGHPPYHVPAAYPLRSLKEGESVTVIYENAYPDQAALYRFWGYWITWKELLFCIVGYVLLFMAAKSIVNEPAKEAMEELENYRKQPRIRKPRYK